MPFSWESVLSNTESARQVNEILFDIGNFYHYANFIEKSLKVEIDEIGTFIQTYGRQPSVDAELWNVSEVFPHLNRSAVLLSVFAFFEHNLNAVCDTLAKEHGKILRVTDLNGRGLERAKTYISKVIGIAFPATSNSWQELANLRQLRNAIAHRDGLLKEDKGLKEYITKSDYISIEHDGHVRLHEGILQYLLDHLELFFKDLETAIANETELARKGD